jgi:hypothetical protein
MRDLGPVRPFRPPEPVECMPPFTDIPIHGPSKTEWDLRASDDRRFGFRQFELACPQ